MSNETTTTYLELTNIAVDQACQSRAAINAATVAEYAEAMGEGDDAFPPVRVFHDGTAYWLADGFHRYAAAKKASLFSIRAEIQSGDRRDAILFAVGANVAHGLRRTNADKTRAVDILLKDPEWFAWSNREIARRCGVDEGLVRKRRAAASADDPHMARKVERNGAVYEMHTENIGKKDGLEDLLSQPCDADEPSALNWIAAPVGSEGGYPTADAVAHRTDPASLSDNNSAKQFEELKSAWDQASHPARMRFVRTVVTPEFQSEVGQATMKGQPAPEPTALTDKPAPAGVLEENPLVTIWDTLRGHTRTYGRKWVADGCPDQFDPHEHFTFTENLKPFRAAVRGATQERRDEFLKLTESMSMAA